MKIQLTIELELPADTAEQLTSYREDLRSLLFDNYVNYATVSHATDAVEWCAKGKVGSDNEDYSAKLIFQHHKTWRDICKNVKWDVKEIK